MVILRDGFCPAALYFAAFAALTYPLLFSFSSRFFTDGGDGLQNVWNLWWVNRAVLSFQSPWYTSYLHYPFGVSLFGHTLNAFNGFLGIVLLRLFSVVQTHNLIVILAFVLGGVNAFLLCRYVTGAYWPSLVGGAIFTFSSYHFAHAQGHLNLVSIEWIPLFLLLWYRLFEKPTVKIGIAAGITLFLVLLCDYYYLLYSAMAGALIAAWIIIVTNGRPLRTQMAYYGRALVAFTSTCIVTCGPLVLGLIFLNARDPFIGAHTESEFSLDLPALVIPGGRWRFADLTKAYWSRLPGNVNESSVDLGVSVVILLVYAWFNRSRLGGNKLTLWYLIAATFGVLSLGPTLHVWGQAWPVPLPYRLFRLLIPPLRLAGVPVRMVVMVFLSGGVIAAHALKLLQSEARSRRVAAGLILLLMVTEYLPYAIPQTPPDVPNYVIELKSKPGRGAVLDLASQFGSALYYETVYDKPAAFGYISRVPSSVIRKDAVLKAFIEDQNYEPLCHDYGIQYVVRPSGELVDLDVHGGCTSRPDAIAALDKIPDIKLPEGSFIKGAGPTIYHFTDGRKHAFPTWATFLEYGGAADISNVVVISDSDLAAIPEGPGLPVDEFKSALQNWKAVVAQWLPRIRRR